MKKIIGMLPRFIQDEYSELDINLWVKAALNLLPDIVGTQEKALILNVENGKVKLPSDYVSTISLRVQTKVPDDSCKNEIIEIFSENMPYAPIIYLKRLLDSSYYNNYMQPLKLTTDTNQCNNCCGETYFIKDCMLYTTLNKCNLILHYNASSEELPDSQILNEYIRSFILKRVFEEKALMKEEGAARMYDMYRQESDILFRRVKGEFILKETNAERLSALRPKHERAYN